MRLLLEWVLQGGFLLDIVGVLGLGLIGLSAARLAKRDGSWGGSLMSVGAALLLAGRLWVLLSPSFLTPGVKIALGDQWLTVLGFLPTLLMTGGFAGVVWGLWGHEKWLKEAR